MKNRFEGFVFSDEAHPSTTNKPLVEPETDKRKCLVACADKKDCICAKRPKK